MPLPDAGFIYIPYIASVRVMARRQVPASLGIAASLGMLAAATFRRGGTARRWGLVTLFLRPCEGMRVRPVRSAGWRDLTPDRCGRW